nr:hypothetical protein [Burkholderia ambifaria]
MTRFDVFNGDADGICALQMAGPLTVAHPPAISLSPAGLLGGVVEVGKLQQIEEQRFRA